MDVIIDLVTHIEEQQSLVVQNVARPRNKVATVLDATALRTFTKKKQLEVGATQHIIRTASRGIRIPQNSFAGRVLWAGISAEVSNSFLSSRSTFPQELIVLVPSLQRFSKHPRFGPCAHRFCCGARMVASQKLLAGRVKAFMYDCGGYRMQAVD